MEPQDWDRIADLLMQIRAKYANLLPQLDENKDKHNDALDYLNALLQLNDDLATMDGKGWL